MSTCVFLFGGYLATKADMDVWVASAKTQQSKVEFNAYHWTEKDKEKKAVAAIKASNADKIYIVGHSSGCANANAVDKALKDTSKIVLVALDGFAPDASQRNRSSTQIWGAVNGKHTSKNHTALKNLLGNRLLEYPARKDCTTKWALHFAVVNANASDSVVRDPPLHLATGYANCRANLMWL
jgi:hypothetical protein